MHQILKNLLARKNKPVLKSDGRKIVLGVFGGLMISARTAAALLAFEELGLTNAFNEIYTYSSGFPNSCYFLAGQMRLGASAYYQEMSGLKFLNWFRPWKLVKLNFLLDVIKNKKSLNVKKLYESKTELYTLVTKVPDLKKGIFLKLADVRQEDFFNLINACTALPFLDSSHVKVGQDYYRDIFYDGALEDFVQKIMAQNPTDVILIYAYDWQRERVHQYAKNVEWSKIYEFCPKFYAGKPVWLQKLSRFETRSKVLKKQCQIFGDFVKQSFDSNEPINLI